ncbi:MAG: hypothetical protein IOD12_18335 [Silvanigrellales bacterium]|nr:hypothetical protein [Silvanigrellales bacterium]
MSIVKVEIKLPEAHHAIVAFAENRMHALESLASLLRHTASEQEFPSGFHPTDLFSRQ